MARGGALDAKDCDVPGRDSNGPNRGNDSDRHGAHDPKLIAALRVRQLFHSLVDREGSRPLARRELLKRLNVLRHDRLRWNQDEQVLGEPFDVIARLLFGTLKGVSAQVEELRRAQREFAVRGRPSGASA